jgi:hypothetical protein
MLPKWQIIGLAALLMGSIGLAIYVSPHTYAHVFLSGQCFHDPVPPECHLPRYRGRGSF